MLSVSAALLSVSAVSFLAARKRWLGAAVFALSLGACVVMWGAAIGPLVQLVLAMCVASALVLLLPLRERAAWPLALVTAAVGGLLLL